MAPKIINIEQDDKVDDLVEIIDNSEASEFFFVVPKSHKVFLDLETIGLLSERANKLKKTITIITSDQRIIAKATETGFRVLEEHKKSSQTQEKQKGMHKTPVREIVSPKADEIETLEVQDVPEKKTEIPINIDQPEILTDTPTEKINLQNNEITFPIKYYRAEEELEKLYNPKNILSEAQRPIKEIIRPSKQKSISPQTIRFSKKILYAILSVFIIVIIFAVLNSNQKAKITITPQKEKATINIALVASENPKNETELLGKLIEVQKTLSKTVNSTGDKFLEQKSTGSIIIYNAFSSAPQTLVATTRFQTKEGLIFRITKTVTVPGAQLENGTLIPGSIKTDVIADKTGVEYNIAPTKFTIPGFIGTSKYDKFSAESESDMKNGFKGKTKFATKEDIDKITNELTQQIKEDLVKEMAKIKGEGMINSYGAEEISISPTEKSSVENTIGEKFTIELSGKIWAMSLLEKDIEKIINTYLSKKGTLKKFIPSSLKYKIIAKKLDTQNKTFSFDLNAELEAVTDVDTQKITKEISGFNEAQIGSYFKNYPDIEKVKILISPFWKHSIPQNRSKISVEVVNP
ncbi:MAG: hypothetical protein HYW77_01800 [Parcubacteria group bacterium]|nr:hypothetical protein [Parcubacteria group bacterium]